MINIVQRNTKNLKFTYKRSDGTPVDVSGYTLSFVCKKFKTGESVIPKKTILLEGTEAENGVFSLSFTESDTDIEVGTYRAQFELSKIGVRVTFLQDNLTIIKNEDEN